MRKYLLPILLISFWGCGGEQEATPTEVTLWGVVYSVEDTDIIDFCYGEGESGFVPTGPIPYKPRFPYDGRPME